LTPVTGRELSAGRPALIARYAAERDKRIRPDGNDQYIPVTGNLSYYLEDPYTPVAARDPRTDHVTFAFVGGGFAGLVTAARLVEAGVKDIRVIEKGGDFGGTWYWNRYPGAQCDTSAMIYVPLLEETGHQPREKYAHAPEILEQCQRIGRQYGLYDNALFHTQVTDLSWDGGQSRWVIRTSRGDEFTASFIGLGTGPLHVPKLPGIPGLRDFKGHTFHTSRWDYGYTGGGPDGGPLTKLAGQKVAIIGTGATAVQAVPHLARSCGTLYVVQRTPSAVAARGNAPIEPDWFTSIATPGWQQRWLDNFSANQIDSAPEVDLVNDGWTDIFRRVHVKLGQLEPSKRTVQDLIAAYVDSDFEKMEEVRARVEAIVEDRETAERLKPWYRQLCKRPCFHDEYLQSFNNPSCRLIDTDGKGVESITEKGFVVAGVEYEVDCIIYASGFEVGTDYTRRSGFDVSGRDGLKLSAAWGEGMRTLHGIHSRGFPNAFFVQAFQGAALISNVPHNLVDSAKTIALTVKHVLDSGTREVEVTRQAQDAWIELLLTGPARMAGGPDCTPGYYNNEGHPPSPAMRYNLGYPSGPRAFFRYMEEWRAAGTFDGLEFR